MSSLDNTTSPLVLVPWIVGIYERGFENPDELNFMRIGMIFSSYLIAVAGYLEFNRTVDNYFVIGGIENNQNPEPQVTANYPDAESSPVKFIRYEDGYVDGSHFSMAIFYLARAFDLKNSKYMSAISPANYRNGADKSLLGGLKYFPADYFNKQVLPAKGYIGGYNNETGQLTYLTTTKEQNYSQWFNENGELGGVNDGCFHFGNFLSSPRRLVSSEVSFGFIGLKSDPDKIIGRKDYTEKDVKFDVPFCPGKDFPNFTNLVIVTPAFRYETLINGAFGCEPNEFSCDTTCFNMEAACDGLPDCSKGQDENAIYCQNKKEYKKNQKNGKMKNGTDDNSDSAEHHIGLKIATIIGIPVLVIILITAVAWKIIRDKNQTIRKLNDKEIKEFIHGKKVIKDEDHIENYEGIAYNKNYEINPKILTTNETVTVLGSGAYGVVTLAELSRSNENKIQVAVKSTKKEADIEYIRSILIEIKIFQYLGQHDYIIGFVGAVTKDIRAGNVSVVMEFCELGSLLEYLKMNTSCITYTQMTRWAFEIASGMEHLEMKKVVHADLASRNILLTCQKSLKITDFGLSRKLYNYDIYSKQNKTPLPWPWMALESLSHLTFSSKSDIWSYGVTLWEIFSGGKTPFVGHTWSSDFVNLIENGLRLSRPINASEEIFNLMEQCWLNLPEDRPKFADIVKDANLFSKNSNIYQ